MASSQPELVAGAHPATRSRPRAAHLRRTRALRLSVVPLLVVATVAAVAAGTSGGTGVLRVAVFVVLLLGVAAAVASDADARAERRELLAERARLTTAFADAHERLVRTHADESDQLAARLTGHIRHLRDHLAAANARVSTGRAELDGVRAELAASRTELAASRTELAALKAELETVRVELARMTRARDALKADVDAYVAVETARIAREQEAVAASHTAAERGAAPGGGEQAGNAAVVDLGTWERRAAG